MIDSFRRGKEGKEAEKVWVEGSGKGVPRQYWIRAKALLQIMHATDSLDDLRIHGEPPSLRLHKLKGDLAGYAIDIDKTSGWRITFKFKAGHFSEVGIQDYH
jgi:plasmid maintenance system killer protein